MVLVYSARVEIERFEGQLDIERPASAHKRVLVVIDERGLVVDDRIECTRDRFFGGALENLQTHFRVLIVANEERPTSQGFWFFKAPDRESAQAMLKAAGLDADHIPLAVQSNGPLWSTTTLLIPFVVWMFQTGCLLLSKAVYGVAELVVLLVAWFAARAAMPRLGRIDLRFGTDGVYRTHLGKRQFFPFIRMKQAWNLGARVAIQLVDGSLVDLKLDGSQPIDASSQVSRDYAIVQLMKMRVLEGIQRAKASIEVFHQDFEIARGARELHAWLVELRKQRVPFADYRTMPQAEIDLDALFVDASLDAQTRAGAAIALRVRDGEKAIERLRVAAATTASPNLRIAFQKIAEGTFDDELEERLDKLR